MMTDPFRAEITDIFSSIQGEGIFVGAKQIFVRFRDCNMKCEYCDETREGEIKNVLPDELMDMVRSLEITKGPHHSVSLTGGEPLLYAGFLNRFLRLLVEDEHKTYLETNGTLPEALLQVIDLVDIVAMDFKLPSSTGAKAFWNEHREFLNIARRKKIFVKAIVTASTVKDDIEKAIEIIKSVDRHIPFILQPATPRKDVEKGINSNTILDFLEAGAKHNLENIRIIPQIHKMLDMK